MPHSPQAIPRVLNLPNRGPQDVGYQYECLPGDIGAGSFGRVYKVSSRSNGVTCALKAIDYARYSCDDKKMLATEVNILKRLRHDNVTAYVDDFDYPKERVLYLVVELCPYGDLQAAIKQRRDLVGPRSGRPGFTEKRVCSIVGQLSRALEHLRELNIVHRDIKPANIFLAGEHVVKLGDYGCSVQLANAYETSRSDAGTLEYMCPEAQQKQPYSFAADVWSLGCVAFELLDLRLAFINAVPVSSDRYNVPSFKRLPLPSTELVYLVTHLLSYKARDRPTAKQVLSTRLVASACRELDRVQGLGEQRIPITNQSFETPNSHKAYQQPAPSPALDLAALHRNAAKRATADFPVFRPQVNPSPHFYTPPVPRAMARPSYHLPNISPFKLAPSSPLRPINDLPRRDRKFPAYAPKFPLPNVFGPPPAHILHNGLIGKPKEVEDKGQDLKAREMAFAEEKRAHRADMAAREAQMKAREEGLKLQIRQNEMEMQAWEADVKGREKILDDCVAQIVGRKRGAPPACLRREEVKRYRLENGPRVEMDDARKEGDGWPIEDEKQEYRVIRWIKGIFS